MMTEVPRKHHYVPQFLLSQWTGEDGRLARYEMPFMRKLVHSWRHPSEVGFVRDLYRYPDADIELQQWPELGLFQKIDDAAATVLRKMLLPQPVQLDSSDRAKWAIFIRSLTHRSPEYLNKSKAAVARINDHLQKEVSGHYLQLRGKNDPLTYADFRPQTHYGIHKTAAL